MMKKVILLLAISASTATSQRVPGRLAAPCRSAGLDLPAGFCATVFAENVGAARHIAVAPNGDVFIAVNPPRGAARRLEAARGTALSDGGLVALRDTDGDGRADMRRSFGRTGGTGIALDGNWLYVTSGNAIVRYRMTPGSLLPAAGPDTVIGELPVTGHRSLNFVLWRGRLYLNIGSETNACQAQDRKEGSAGKNPCTELDSRAGIWEFDTNQLGQRQSNGRRYATGIRNAVALAVNPNDGLLYATVHGRDQLSGNWPRLFTPEQNAETPGEVMIRVDRGADYGWPYCYFDPGLATLVLAPEYGGDGRTVGQCASRSRSLMSFPAHWAPNAMLFYSGNRFPQEYRNGAFIAFHGSWNRAPLPQAGFRVAFAPFGRGGPAGTFSTFAGGFMPESGGATLPATGYRPTGLAQGPDGALFITDDARGTIWRITHGRSR